MDFPTTLHPKQASLRDYHRLQFCKEYLQEQSKRCWNSGEHRRIGKFLGYNTEKGSFFDRFVTRRREYDNLEREVPWVYLEAIGVREDELKRRLAQDMQAFEEALLLPRYPRGAAVRLMPTIYIAEYFAHGTTEREALQFLCKKHPSRICIVHYVDLLLVRIQRWLRCASYSFNPPSLVFSKSGLSITENGRSTGRLRVKSRGAGIERWRQHAVQITSRKRKSGDKER